MTEQIHIESFCTLILRILYKYVPWTFGHIVLFLIVFLIEENGAKLWPDLQQAT